MSVDGTIGPATADYIERALDKAEARGAEFVARKFIRGLRRRNFLIVPGFMGRLSLFVKGVAPRLLFLIVDRDLRKAQKKMAGETGKGVQRA